MARIPDAQLDRLKQDISLQRLVEAQGIALKKHGADLIGLCPFHDDHDPSLVISPQKNLWHCLGACQSGGSVIDWVMKAEGVSFRHAVELLQADYQPVLAAASSSEPIKRATTRKLHNPLPRDAEDQQLLNRVIAYYHDTLKQSPDALAYLEKRGLTDPDLIEHFQLGLANRTLGYRLPAKNRAEGAALRGQLQRIGLLRTSGHEHFNGSLVIPILDEHHNVVEVYGRKLNDNLRQGTPKHLYLPGPHAGVWNLDALKASPEIILCEALIDALTFWCAGYRHVTASYGVEGFTADHLAAFKAHGTERVLIAYDRDAGGDAAADKLATQLNAEGLDAYRIQFPKGMDANAYALQVTPASNSLGIVIRSAHWLGQGQAKPLPRATAEPGLVIDPETGEVLSAISDDSASVATLEPIVTVSQPNASLAAAPAASSEPTVPGPASAMPLPAHVIPPTPQPEPSAEVKDHEILIAFGERRYRLRGLERNPSLAALKINLLVSAPGLEASPNVHVDHLDLYSAKARVHYTKQAAAELGFAEEVIKRDLGQLLLKCEALQEQRLNAEQAPTSPIPSMSDAERQAALDFLQAPNLLERLISDFAQCGIVGETSNLLTAYLAAVSRHLEQPLAILIQSTSAAGKSALMEAVLELMPEEVVIQYSAMTGQSLYYLGETDLQHKILAIAEEEGMSEAAYALKLLQSQGQLSIASTGKDPVTGELKTRTYHVQGPVMIMLTTTAIEIDEELKNRCLVLTVNETREQTQAIQQRQRFAETLDGLLAEHERQTIHTRHHHAQRLFQPLHVVNPYAERLTFLDDRTRTRRDQRKYLTLIRAIALLHQHQRPRQSVHHHGQRLDYIEVTLADIEQANRLAHEVLGRTLDELPPQTRRLLGLIQQMVSERCRQQAIAQADYRFSRREVREYSGWSEYQVRIHMQRLLQLEYLLTHRGSRGQSFIYELVYDGNDQDAQPHVNGLIDVQQLKDGYDSKFEGQTADPEAPTSGQRGPNEAASSTTQNAYNARRDGAGEPTSSTPPETQNKREKHNGASYRSASLEPGPLTAVSDDLKLAES